MRSVSNIEVATQSFFGYVGKEQTYLGPTLRRSRAATLLDRARQCRALH